MSGKFSDQFLIAASIAGDEQAFGRLYDKYVEELYRFVVMRVASRHEAQDLVGEVFLKAWQYLSSKKKQIEDFRALLYRIARNLVIDYYRASKKEYTTFEEGQLENIIDTASDLAEETQKKDDLRIVFTALDQLPDDHRELILLRYVQDLSIKEIALIQGKTNGAIRVALHRAIKQVKNLISDF